MCLDRGYLVSQQITPRLSLARFGKSNLWSNSMAARQAQRRGTPVLHNPQPKTALNVEEWEAKAPLTDREITSVGILKTASEKAPLPYKVRVYSRLALFYFQILYRSLPMMSQARPPDLLLPLDAAPQDSNQGVWDPDRDPALQCPQRPRG